MKDLKVNQEIRAEKVLLIDEDGKQAGIVSLDQALYLAYEKGYDLVQMNDSNPPLVKLMDYGKYIYTQEKNISKQKVKSKSGEIKEVRLGIKIDPHDLDVKINQINKFFSKGDKVKISIQLLGRQMNFQDKARDLIKTILEKTHSEYEKPIERLGNRFHATISPKKL